MKIKKYFKISVIISMFVFLIFLIIILLFFKKNNSINCICNNKVKNLKNAPNNYILMRKAISGKYKTNNGFSLLIKDGVASIDGNIIINKTFSVPNFYKAKDPVNSSFNGFSREGSEGGLEKHVYKKFLFMKAEAFNDGINLIPTSCYRCYEYQKQIYNNCINKYGKEKIDLFISRPGCSEHQTGLAIDLNSINSSFEHTKECAWINSNCYKYGFIIRYPYGEENYTGYKYESWHIRYVGRKLAQILYNNGNWISLEHYYGITSKY